MVDNGFCAINGGPELDARLAQGPEGQRKSLRHQRKTSVGRCLAPQWGLTSPQIERLLDETSSFEGFPT
jgi:hypothetical protein